jgi:hypothetical protein
VPSVEQGEIHAPNLLEAGEQRLRMLTE